MEKEIGFFVDNDAIKYRELRRGGYLDNIIIPKELFIEAYNKWIQGDMEYRSNGEDDWGED
jgi:hypothetical protein